MGWGFGGVVGVYTGCAGGGLSPSFFCVFIII